MEETSSKKPSRGKTELLCVFSGLSQRSTHISLQFVDVSGKLTSEGLGVSPAPSTPAKTVSGTISIPEEAPLVGLHVFPQLGRLFLSWKASQRNGPQRTFSTSHLKKIVPYGARKWHFVPNSQISTLQRAGLT